MAIVKSKGTTSSERYLAELCERSFLSLWSYPNVYRDQGKGGPKDIGKELCDLLVVCGKDVIIFSDKSCKFSDTGDLERDWARWSKRAVIRSSNQIYGAERWIKQYPDRLFLDKKCSQRFPLLIAPEDELNIHRVIVALGAKSRCKKELGGSGSLVLCPGVIGTDHTDPRSQNFRPFFVGRIHPHKDYIHIFDDVSLDIVLSELDTITDFVNYLRTKERIIDAGKLAIAAGEENLLAAYSKDTNEHGQHDILLPSPYKQLVVEDGLWDWFKGRPEYTAKILADKLSYLWDEIIQDFSQHALQGTLIQDSSDKIAEHDLILQIMAKESRHSRRMLSTSMIDRINESPSSEISTRVIRSSHNTDTAYVFLLVPEHSLDSEQSRDFRRNFLSDYCFVFAWKYRDLKQVVGIATEADPATSNRSHDAVLVRPGSWTTEMEADAKKIQKTRDILFDHKLSQSNVHSEEYPKPSSTTRLASQTASEIPRRSRHPRIDRKVGRNSLCPCGSGFKFKRCCGRN